MLRTLIARWNRTFKARNVVNRRRPACRLGVEALENRCLLDAAPLSPGSLTDVQNLLSSPALIQTMAPSVQVPAPAPVLGAASAAVFKIFIQLDSIQGESQD